MRTRHMWEPMSKQKLSTGERRAVSKERERGAKRAEGARDFCSDDTDIIIEVSKI